MCVRATLWIPCLACDVSKLYDPVPSIKVWSVQSRRSSPSCGLRTSATTPRRRLRFREPPTYTYVRTRPRLAQVLTGAAATRARKNGHPCRPPQPHHLHTAHATYRRHEGHLDTDDGTTLATRYTAYLRRQTPEPGATPGGYPARAETHPHPCLRRAWRCRYPSPTPRTQRRHPCRRRCRPCPAPARSNLAG